MTTPLTVVQALSKVMEDVQAVKKTGHNQQQNFNFRGVDAVVNAVGPALRKHGVVVVPLVEDLTQETYLTKSGTSMRNVTLKVRWAFHGPAGDVIEAVSYGEASDAGDKAVSKAHSVAYRIVLIQALCIPTDEPDPDSTTFERGTPSAPVPSTNGILQEIRKVTDELGWSREDVMSDWAQWGFDDTPLLEAPAETLTDYLKYLRTQGTKI